MINNEKVLSIISCPSELAAGKNGNAQGVKQLIEFFQNSTHFSKSHFAFSPVQNKITFGKSYPNAKHIEQIHNNLAAAYHTIRDEMREGRFCLNILGDHSNAIASVSVFSDIYGIENTGLIWIDAHADLHSPYTTPSGNIHGMPLAALLGKDNKESMQNAVSVETAAWWDRLKNIGLVGKRPKLLSQNLVIIGLRDYEKQEMELIQREKIKFFTPQQIKSDGIEIVIQQACDYLQHCNRLCCSFDVDSMDASFVKGTGTPAKNGMTPQQAKYIIEFILSNETFKALDITEFNPSLDADNETFELVSGLFS
ncbi:MAG: arginase [Bacteroidia bacterium]|jgi:arginase|nr:arginase [Bacteroidia bacterium]MCO5252777.1 arginase [Bacteroidota bacterium]MCZ2129562.1 arginase [Bacteroidia bacterium]